MPSPTRHRSKPIPPVSAASLLVESEEAAQLLKMLANGLRLRVLCLLAEGELSVGQINARVELSQSALSQHLAKLREQGLVTTRRDAQTIYYRLPGGPAKRVIDTLHAIYCEPDARTARGRRRSG
jgi:DNA-binding transcriptional ArsR family regulator